MLYVYDINGTLDEEREKAIKNCKDLKEWDELYYIGKTKSFISNGREIIADETFKEFVEYYWEEAIGEEWIDIDLAYPIDNITFTNEYAVRELIETLDYEDEYSDIVYSDRIFNSENLYMETATIIDEITLISMEYTIDILKDEVKIMKDKKHISWK